MIDEHDIKGPFSFSGKIEKTGLSDDMEGVFSHLETLKEVEGFKDRINLVMLVDFVENDEQKEIREIREMTLGIYENYLNNFHLIYPNGKKGDTVLFNVPSGHASNFLPVLAEKKYDKESPLSDYNIEYVIMDSPSLDNFGEDIDWLEYSYNHLFKKASKADKYINIRDYQGEPEDFINNPEHKKEFEKIIKKFRENLKELKSVKPHGLTDFPSEQQAKLAGISLKELCKVFLEAGSLDWPRINEANEELAEIYRDFDTVSIKGEYVDIDFDIKGQGAINSVIATNYPGSEVYTGPNIDGVNGWITYNNNIRIKKIGETIKGIKFEFKNGLLEKFEIIGDEYSEERKIDLTEKLQKLFFAKEKNRRIGELAFGTNFYVEPGFLHSLIGEKALGMHIALGNSYLDPEDDEGKNQKVDNGNHGADYHIDLIRKMDDGSVATFKKDNGEELIVMDNGKFEKLAVPKLYDYQTEIEQKKS